MTYEELNKWLRDNLIRYGFDPDKCISYSLVDNEVIIDPPEREPIRKDYSSKEASDSYLKLLYSISTKTG